MKFVLVVLIGTGLLLLMMFVSPIFINKTSAGNAFVEWQLHPTPETEKAWLYEDKKMMRKVFQARMALGPFLAANIIGILSVAERVKAKAS